MAIDTPATIAILGAGPIGLEAALYARSLGYHVKVFERGAVAENVLAWGHVRMFSPFAMNRSALGLAALAAQDANYRPPGDEAMLTGRQWAEQYLMPLAGSDLLDGVIREQTTVVRIGRSECLKVDAPGSDERAQSPFQILSRSADQAESIEAADAVIDTTGVFGNPNWLGRGGIPAIGEAAIRNRIEFGMPDLAGADRQAFAGSRILVVGSGYSAATNIVELAAIAQSSPGTSVTWVTRRHVKKAGPMSLIPNDRLPERDRLARAVNDIASNSESAIEHRSGTVVEEITTDGEEFHVRFGGRHEWEEKFDRIIANVGCRPDHSILEELQVHVCFASEGPIKLAAALLGQASADCLDQSSCGPQSLVNPEPNLYIVGAKSYGRNSSFLVSVGLEQIREIFTIIGGREDLDLYTSVQNLVP